MPVSLEINRFKQALHGGEQQIGLWLGLANSYAAEICACAGFDFLMLDAEHAPNDLQTLLAQLQAIRSYPSHPAVRVASHDAAMIKQILDLGAQTLLVPTVESAEQATALVRATRYPPEGVRGVGTALARASRWNSIADYLHTADEQMCLLVQVETARGIQQLESIARVTGVDGVFIGPADLAASLNYRGQSERPEVQSVIEDAIVRIRKCDKPTGILAAKKDQARRFLELGCTFVAVGIDTHILQHGARALAESFRAHAGNTMR